MKENRYKALRQSTETELTQEELAQEFQKQGNPVSQVMISKVENRKKEVPTTSFTLLKAYSDYFNEDGTMKKNENYTAILELAGKLKENNIQHELVPFLDGWKIICLKDGENSVGDCVQHLGSYGHEYNLLEVYGFGLDKPIGWLPVEAVFEYFKKAIELKKVKFREIKK